MEVLELENVTKNFGGLTAVSGFNLRIAKGQMVGLIGPNGAGKTTVFNMVTGIYPPTGGDIRMNSETVVGKRPHEISQRGVGRTFQNLRLFKDLSVIDNVLIAGQLAERYTIVDALFRTPGFRSREKALRQDAERLLDLVGLGPSTGLKARNLAYGHQRRLEIARALATKPQLLLLDEPAAGMNPDESIEIMRFIGRIRRDFGLTILLIEHHMEVVMGLCERVVVLNFGRTIAEGSPAEIQSNRDVIAAYLGEEDDSAGGQGA